MKKGLDKLVEDKKDYDLESQAFIESLQFADKEIVEINTMKRTGGWKIMDKKIREELQQRINDLVKEDLKIQTLLALLNVADTKKMSVVLEEEIEKILPSG